MIIFIKLNYFGKLVGVYFWLLVHYLIYKAANCKYTNKNVRRI